MKGPAARKAIEKFLNASDIQINRNNPWDLQVNNPNAFERIVNRGSLALGESYVDQWWESKALDQFFENIFAKKPDQNLKSKP